MFIEIYDWCDKRDNENLGEWRYSAINWIFKERDSFYNY